MDNDDFDPWGPLNRNAAVGLGLALVVFAAMSLVAYSL